MSCRGPLYRSVNEFKAAASKLFAFPEGAEQRINDGIIEDWGKPLEIFRNETSYRVPSSQKNFNVLFIKIFSESRSNVLDTKLCSAPHTVGHPKFRKYYSELLKQNENILWRGYFIDIFIYVKSASINCLKLFSTDCTTI